MEESEDIDKQIQEGNRRLSRSHVCGQEERREEQQ
jgi:hypothetical protein